MTKTIKDHFEDCKTVEEVLDNGNALLTRARAQLVLAREVLEKLIEYQHPKLSVDVSYSKIAGDAKSCSPADLIKWEIGQINNLLGDRA